MIVLSYILLVETNFGISWHITLLYIYIEREREREIERKREREPVALTFASYSKKIRNFSVQPVVRGINDLRVGGKVASIQLFFSVQGTGGSPTVEDPENRVGVQDIGNPSRPASSGLQGPGELGHFCARTRQPW